MLLKTHHKLLIIYGEPLVVDGVFLYISDDNPIKLIQKDVERAGEFVDRIKQIEEQTGGILLIIE